MPFHTDSLAIAPILKIFSPVERNEEKPKKRGDNRHSNDGGKQWRRAAAQKETSGSQRPPDDSPHLKNLDLMSTSVKARASSAQRPGPVNPI
jgi:hypothetical protein